jgi:hypothetical protein
MLYRLYCSSGNTVGVDEYVCYSEIGVDGYWLRYIEIKADGTAVRYRTDHAADSLGTLPDGQWDETEASKKEYGVVTAISKELFESLWIVTRCGNWTPSV